MKRTVHPEAQPVIIKWIDSMGHDGWYSKTPDANFACITAGILVSKDDDRVVVCQNRSHYSDGEIMQIPMVAVKSIRKLK